MKWEIGVTRVTFLPLQWIWGHLRGHPQGHPGSPRVTGQGLTTGVNEAPVLGWHTKGNAKASLIELMKGVDYLVLNDVGQVVNANGVTQTGHATRRA